MTNSDHLTTFAKIVADATPLGVRSLADGTQLIGRVPHVGSDAWLHALFAGLSDSEIQEVERRAGRSLPSEYRQFLRRNNGISIFSGALYIAGLRNGYSRQGDAVWQPFAIEEANVLERPRDANPDLVFIGGYKSDGSRLYMATDSPEVFRCQRDSSRPQNSWPSLVTMLNEETARLAAHFDEQGRRRDPSRTTAPVGE